MHYRRLGRTGLKVSALCLGTMQFGWTADEVASHAILDAFAQEGGNFLDTADVYSSWAPNNPGGVSEQIIGSWLQARGNRQQVIVATKARGRMWPGPNGEGLSRAHLIRACEDSLRRLQTDYIDLYQSHWLDGETPIEETLAAFDTLVQQGKVRYMGCSNLSAWRLVQALWASDRLGLARYDSIQPHYNLANRAEFERDLKEVVASYGLGIIPYSPLAGGFLTGKYERATGSTSGSASVRADGIQKRYFTDAGWQTLDAVRTVATESNSTPTAVALAWLLAQPNMTAPIIGANSPDQLRVSLAAAELTLTAEQVTRLEQASAWQ
jgi:aryl-alcohol dehydrogenase-like predicted oxidoreductase